MKGFMFFIVAILATANVSYGIVELDYTTNPDPGEGYNSYTVRATGIGIDELHKFRITGDVYQVWTAPNTQSAWLHNANTPGDPMDSYIIFGDQYIGPYSVTLETIHEGGTEGLGTLNNYSEIGGEDAYLKTDFIRDYVYTYDIFHLVVPENDSVFVEMDIYTAEYNPNSGWYDLITQYEFFGEDGLMVGVPEPCVFALVLLGTMCLLMRRVRGR